MSARPRITFYHTDGVERQTLAPLAGEAQARGYPVAFSGDPYEPGEIAVACYHSTFPRPRAKLSVILLHDIAQGHLNWPDFWRNEHWDKYDIGILPGQSWVHRWQQCSWKPYCNARLGVYEAGWPKADVVFANRDHFRSEAAKLRDHLGLKHERTVIYTPSWENHGKQIDFVESLKDLPVNLVVKQAAWSEKHYPHIVKEVRRLAELHSKYAPNVVVGDPEINIMLYLGLADIIVSDESSIMLEGLLFNIPSVAVMDWLVPDTNPPRHPGVPFDFVTKTTRNGMHDAIRDILGGLKQAQDRLEQFRQAHFSHLGRSSTMILDILEYHLGGRAECIPSLAPSPKPGLDDFPRDPVSGCHHHPAYGSTLKISADAGRIFDVIVGVRDRSTGSNELKSKITDPLAESAFSPVCSNLLRPFAFAGKRVLVVGAGAGALTRYLGEQGAFVDALEPDFSWARCAALRCADLPNVRVFRTLPNDFHAIPQYDSVLLIGALTAGPRLFEDDDPVQACFRFAARCLLENGFILFAGDNRMGLKYLMGGPDDITGQPFSGIGDLYTSRTGQTLGREELLGQLRKSGLTVREVLYPFPDHRYSEVIVTEAGMSDADFAAAPLVETLRVRSKNARIHDALAWRQVEANGLMPGLANSFLVVAGKEAGKTFNPDTLAFAFCSHCASDHNWVRVFRKAAEGIEITTSSWKGRAIPDIKLTGAFSENLGAAIVKCILQQDRLGAEALLNSWYRFLRENGAEPDLSIKPAFIDCIPENLFMRDGSLTYVPSAQPAIEQCGLAQVLLRGFFHLQTRFDLEEFILNRNSGIHKMVRAWLLGIGIQFNDELLRGFAELESRLIDEINGSGNPLGLPPVHHVQLASIAQYAEQNLINREQGRLYFDKGLVVQALREFSAILKRDPDDTEALLYLARISKATSRHEDEAHFFRLVLEKDPGCEEARNGLEAALNTRPGPASI